MARDRMQKGATPMKRLICITAMSLLLWPIYGAASSGASQADNSQTVTAQQKREAYQTKMAQNLNALDQQIGALKVKIGKLGKTDHPQFDQQMAELERKREVARERLEKLKASSQGAWVEMKAGIDEAMDDLQRAYQRASAHFK